MEKAKAERIASKAVLKRWLELFCLTDWRVELIFKEMDSGSEGECETYPNNKVARIYINHKVHDTREQLLDTLQHEIIHIIHSDFDYYRDSVEKQLTPETTAILSDIFTLSEERFVTQMQHIVKKLGIKLNGQWK